MAAEDIHEEIEYDRRNACCETTGYGSGYGEHYASGNTLGLSYGEYAVCAYRRYASGCQPCSLTLKQQKLLQGVLTHQFSDNVCHQIIAEAVARVSFLRWQCPDALVEDFLRSFYITAKIADRQGEVHYGALRDGNFVVAVNWDNVAQQVRIYREPWWDGHCGTFIGYDDQDNPKYGVKEWTEKVSKIKRRIIWFPERLERWQSEDFGTSWVKTTIAQDYERWPRVWTQKDGTPLGIPYIHFPNAARGEINYGTSELSGGVLGFQDQLNDLQMAMSIAARLTAFQVYTIAGIELEDDPQKPGHKKDVDIGPAQVLTSTNPDTKFGTLGPGDLSQLLALYNKKLARVSQITRTPLHLITGGDWPSGEAILHAELPAVGKAALQINKFAVCWSTLAWMAVRLRNRFGVGPALVEDAVKAPITASFDPPERRDPVSRSLVVRNLDGYISREEGLVLFGYPEAKAKRVAEQKMEEDKIAATLKAPTAVPPPPGPPPKDVAPNGAGQRH